MGEATPWRARCGLLILAGCAAALPGTTLAEALEASAGASSPAPTGDLSLVVRNLRSTKGMIRACLTRNPAFFPKCEHDPLARKVSIAAQGNGRVNFADLPPGDYALMVLHDENGNAKIDTMLGIPKEGVGFSRNPVLRFGPPKWDAVRIHVPSGPSATDVTMKYFL